MVCGDDGHGDGSDCDCTMQALHFVTFHQRNGAQELPEEGMRVKGVPNQHSSLRPNVRPIVSLRHTFRVHRLVREFPWPPSISLLPEPKAFAPPAPGLLGPCREIAWPAWQPHWRCPPS